MDFDGQKGLFRYRKKVRQGGVLKSNYSKKISFRIGRWLTQISHRINNKKTVTFCFLLSSHPKTTTMQKKYWISLCLITVGLIASLLLSNTAAPQKEKPTCCKKAEKECPDNTKPDAPAETSLEPFSHQFISFPVFFN